MSRALSSFFRLTSIFFALTMLLSAADARAAKTCYDCHKKQKQEWGSRKVVHDPLKSEQCESCHGRHGFAQNLVLKAYDNQLCYSCHKDLQEKFASGSVHFPVGQGLCWDCHDPHASDKKWLLRPVAGTDDPASCLLCHDSTVSVELKATHPHKPFNDLDCLACHEAHNSASVPLLKQDASALCMSCHQGDAVAMAKAHEGKHTESLGCIDCHSGHATNKPGLLSDRTHAPFADGDCETCHSVPDSSGKVSFAAGATKNSICATCHDEQARAESKPVPHPAVTADNCSDCHKPHSSRQGKLLVKAEGELCKDCHADVITDSDLVKHQPALEGNCSACHETHGSERTHLLRKVGSDLCLQCHSEMAAARDSSLSVHAAMDDCLSCHSPHEGVGPAMLRKPVEKLCADCHEPDAKAQTASSVHAPYMTGECAGCHQPHFSSKKALLRAEGPPLCLTCHTDIGNKLTLPNQHAPAGEDCLGCHKPHYADQRSLLTESPGKLCLSCHDGAELGLQKAHVHTPARDGDCTGCHDPHGSERPKLIAGRAMSVVVGKQTMMIQPTLTDQRASLCYVCHQEMGDRIQKNAAHKPVKDGNCEVCHTSHGSDQPGFVKAPAPELCEQCHTVDSTLNVAHKGFNVAKADCLDCHNPHISTAAKLVRSISHPPFAEGACEDCHQKGPDGSVVPVANISEVCTTCHDGIADEMKLASKHPPFESGECVGCHRVHAADEPKLLKAETSQLCFQCHDDLRHLDTLASVHRPFGENKCTDCHKPHASANAGLLTKPPEVICLDCHTALKESLAKGEVHAPVKDGKCVACHEVHAGTHKALLLADKKSLCGKCHDLTSPTMHTAHKGFDITQADCQSCHAPHVGQKGTKGLLLPRSHKPFALGQCDGCHQDSSPTQFVASGVQLCAKCHDDATKKTANPVVHPALEGENSCTACHSPHAGFGAGLQKKDGVQQCLSCHNSREFTGPVKHAPAFEDCGTCHNPHSSQYKNLLDTQDVMKLCLGCHENAQKTHFHPMGAGVLDPRTRTELICTGCHSPHSTTEKNLLIADKTRKLCNLCHGTEHE